MRFTYTYRSSDGQRHSAEIDAEGRDAAYARLRTEYGIKPIKLIVSDGKISDTVRDSGTSHKLLAISLSLIVIALLALLVIWRSHWSHPPAQIIVNTPQGSIAYVVASPLSRQTIRGDRQRIESAIMDEGTSSTAVFSKLAERVLARFAEPGRAVPALDGTKLTEAEFVASLREPIRIASTDLTEVADLKRIVTGMKREMQAYLAGGGTAEAYIAELEKRQRLEISYRENAERRLNEMLSIKRKPPLKEAYDYWLKANAQLQAMGIYPLALPNALRAYQMVLDIDK